MPATYPLKRYAVFFGMGYYPNGGMLDLHETFDTWVHACLEADRLLEAEKVSDCWTQVLDTHNGRFRKEYLSPGHPRKEGDKWVHERAVFREYGPE